MDGEDIFVSGGPLTSVNFAAQGIEEVLQNVRIILATIQGELFLDRDLGVPGEIVDEPQSKFHRHLSTVAAAVERNEPRCRVTRIALQNPGQAEAIDGKVIPGVWVRIREGVLL
ncbi:MAG: hypothetical protein LBS30_04255 [Planctomycetota bacterium]|jgi:phage baseplate assembly protein W|nr:hypothetical protein [Planctomycetota bacterium]